VQITRCEPAIGAEIGGVDVTALSGREWEAIYRTWLDCNVIVVRGQNLTMPQFLDYSRRFGTLKPHRVRRTRHPEHPEVTVMGVDARKTSGPVSASIRNRGADWHTDSPWDTEICKATQLYALAIPSSGGDTLFASMYAAYDALPGRLKARIEGLSAAFGYGGRSRQGFDLLEPEDQARPPAVHPIVRTHPESGRKSLYVNPTHILGIVGLPEAEGAALIEELLSYMLQPGAQHRHKWRVGDLVIWDNRCSVHAAAGGHPPDESRIHWRVTIMEPV